MKQILSLLLCLCLTCAFLPLTAAAAGPMEEVLGVYEGYYYANQGQTGVTLSVYETAGGDVEVIFDFYNLPNRS